VLQQSQHSLLTKTPAYVMLPNNNHVPWTASNSKPNRRQVRRTAPLRPEACSPCNSCVKSTYHAKKKRQIAIRAWQKINCNMRRGVAESSVLLL
jgi:hypothetical protein